MNLWRGGDVTAAGCFYQLIKMDSYYFINKYLEGKGQDTEARLTLVVPSDITKGNGHKVETRKFHLDVRKSFCTWRVLECWSRLFIEFPSVETYEPYLDAIL